MPPPSRQVVIGEIEPGGTVEDASVLLHQADEFHLPQILGALKHHVLEQVGEAGAVLGLDAESDAVIDRGDDRGRGVIGRKDHAQAVGQLVVGDGHGETLWQIGRAHV